LEGVKLFIGIHDKAHGALSLILDEDHFFHSIIFAGQQPAGFQRNVFLHMIQHCLPVLLTYD
jgi:hypothetical protein